MRSSLVAAAVALLSLVVASSAAAKAPSAVTGAATSVGATTAVVEGKVDAGGEATSWYVEYGTSTSYGSRTGARSGGNGTSAVDVSEQLRGLTTGATYHYRLVASNGYTALFPTLPNDLSQPTRSDLLHDHLLRGPVRLLRESCRAAVKATLLFLVGKSGVDRIKAWRGGEAS